MRDHDKDFERIDRRSTEVDAMMPTEKGPVTVEMIRAVENLNTSEEVCAALNSALAPILAAERALAAAEMRKALLSSLKDALRQAQQENMNLPQFSPGLQQAITVTKNFHIPDEDSLRGLVEYAFGCGTSWQHYLENDDEELMEQPTPESVLADFIERSRK